MCRWHVFPALSDGAFCTPSCGKDGTAVFVKVMLGRDTGITLQNEAESHTTEVKPLPGDAITLLAFSAGSSVFFVPGGNLRSPRGMGAWAVYTTGCLSSPSSRRRLLATWGAAEETS